MQLRLEDYALISNCNTAALISRNGSIDWMCLPRFDSPACFAAILGDSENGCWKIAPSGEFRTQRKYIEGTVVLETAFETETGKCILTDCLLMGESHPRLVRIIEGIHGFVDIEMLLIIRFDYGSIVPWVRRLVGDDHGIRAIAGPDIVTVTSSVKFEGHNFHTTARFKVGASERLSFVLTWHNSASPEPARIENPYLSCRRTTYWWKEWSDRCQYKGEDRESIVRSLLTLKALIYEPTGAIVAAPTTSIPEKIGGQRNWDYRYCWLRDSTFTLYALLSAGYREEADHWRRWLVRAVAGTPSQVNIMYGLSGERRLTEEELDWLPGYENSRPVRIGNAAHTQVQLDVFGEVMDTLSLARQSGLPHDENSWRIQKKMVSHLEDNWCKPDEGIWEIRGPSRQFTHSKVMAWVAVDRGIKAIQRFNLDGPLDEWTNLRNRIHRDICENGFNANLNSFVQTYGGRELDASLLMLALVGFLPPDDPRILGTIEAIRKYLCQDGLIIRYRTETQVDGLPPGEGAFLACTFWLADNLILTGKRGEAKEIFNHVCSLRNDVGLFAEEFDTNLNRMVGNFPQAFSHISHVNTALNFSEAYGPAGDRSHR